MRPSGVRGNRTPIRGRKPVSWRNRVSGGPAGTVIRRPGALTEVARPFKLTMVHLSEAVALAPAASGAALRSRGGGFHGETSPGPDGTGQGTRLRSGRLDQRFRRPRPAGRVPPERPP